MSIYRDAALAGWDAGLSMVKIAETGIKKPDGPWKQYQEKRASRSEVEDWYREAPRTGVGFVTGAISGHVRLFEFDCRTTYGIYLEAADNIGIGDLVARIRAGYEEETPGEGIHWLVRVKVDGGNTKLAKRPKRPEEKRHAGDNWQVLIETREDGGFAVTAPSGGTVHPTGKAYRLISGGFDTITEITAEEWRALCTLAQAFDQTPVREYQPAATVSRTIGGRPGDDFAARTDWPAILEPAGWTFAYQHGDTAYWWRPGKGRGESISATTNYAGSGYLYIFSTSTDFEAERAYGKFPAYAILHHGGDFKAAARELARQGYGTAAPAVEPLAPLEPLDLGSAPAANGCPELAEENARLRVELAEERRLRMAERQLRIDAQQELAAIKEALFEAKDYTLQERVTAIAAVEDLDQAQQRGKADDEGFTRSANTVVAQRIGIKAGNLGKHLTVVETAGVFECRRENIRALDPKTGRLKPNTAIYRRLNGSKVEALRTFARSTRTEPSKWGGTRPTICPKHPHADIVTKTHVTYHCSTCDRLLAGPEGIFTPPTEQPAQDTQVGQPSVSNVAPLEMDTQVGYAARHRRDPKDGKLTCIVCGKIGPREVCPSCEYRIGQSAEAPPVASSIINTVGQNGSPTLRSQPSPALCTECGKRPPEKYHQRCQSCIVAALPQKQRAVS